MELIVNKTNNEIWSPIINLYDNIKPYYFISTYGRVYSLATNNFIIPHENHNGYMQVSLMTNTGRVFRKVHRLVMLTFAYFYGCESLQVNHKDTNKKNNYLYNLEWVTPKQNTEHAILNNCRDSKGSNNPMAKITSYNALHIYDLIIAGYNDDQISSIIGCSKSIVREIALGHTWKHLFSNEQLLAMRSTRKGNIFPNELKHAICNYYQNNINNYTKKYGRATKLINGALDSLGLENNQFNYNISHRLFYRLQDNEITSQYKY